MITLMLNSWGSDPFLNSDSLLLATWFLLSYVHIFELLIDQFQQHLKELKKKERNIGFRGKLKSTKMLRRKEIKCKFTDNKLLWFTVIWGAWKYRRSNMDSRSLSPSLSVSLSIYLSISIYLSHTYYLNFLFLSI